MLKYLFYVVYCIQYLSKYSLGKGAIFVISKELKRLSRRELVDIIYQLKKEEQEKQEKIAALEAALAEKRLRIASAGSVAEAAAEITQLLSTVQATADLYLQEIASMKEDTKKECAQLLAEAQQQADKILAEARNNRG